MAFGHQRWDTKNSDVTFLLRCIFLWQDIFLHTTTLLTVAASDDESGIGIIIGGLSMDGTYQGLEA